MSENNHKPDHSLILVRYTINGKIYEKLMFQSQYEHLKDVSSIENCEIIEPE